MQGPNRDRETPGGIIGSEVPQADVIDGWEIRNRDYNSIATNGLSPFVQLIGLYNDEEIDRLVQRDQEVGDRTVSFVNDDGEWEGDTEGDIIADQESFRDQIRSKFIEINIQNYNGQVDIDGIVLATNASQVGNDAYETYDNGLPKDSGGIGITDLQIETGTKDFMNRRYKLRLTVTDPFILNDQKEYLKLSTLQSQFLLIHGWSNPHQIEDMDQFDSPPIVDENKRMTVDLTNQNTGGMWSAATVAITMFDFAFNETGQLEANFTFMPREISFAATYRIDLVAPTTQLFLGTGEETTNQTNEDIAVNGEKDSYDFLGLVAGFGSVAGEFGKNMADIIDEEQQAYFNNNPGVAGLFSNMNLDFDAADTLRNVSEEISQWSQAEGNVDLGVLMDNQRQAEGRNRFPYAGPGIRRYSEQTIEVPSNPQDPESEKITVTRRNSSIQYYYLGWLMEAIRFSMWDLNKNRVKNGQTPFDLKFKYYKIPEDSQFNLAFQDELQAGTHSEVKEIYPELIKASKKKYIPKDRRWDPVAQELFAHYVDAGYFSGPICPSSVNKNWQNENISVAPISADDIRNRWAAYFGQSKPFGDGNAPLYNISDGYTDDPEFDEWHNLTRQEKFEILREKTNGRAIELEFVEGGQGVREKTIVNSDTNEEEYVADYRKCLFEVGPSDPAYDPNNILVRIMHPDYDGQLLYNWTWKNKWIWIDPTELREESSCGAYASAGNGPAGAGSPGCTWVYSKLNNFFIGEVLTNTVWMRCKDTTDNWWNPFDGTGGTRGIKWEMSDTDHAAPYMRKPGLGIIMPAVSARYYSPGLYLDAQQRWYNKHITFLHAKMENLIREKILDSGKFSLNSIMNESLPNGLAHYPVDLEYMTGRVYDHKLPYFFENSDGGKACAGQAGQKPDWDMRIYGRGGSFQSRAKPYSLQEYNASNVVYGGEADIITSQQQEIIRANNERQLERTVALNGNGTGNVDSNPSYQMSLSLLENMKSNEERYSVEQIYKQSDVVANILKDIAGQTGVATFWENQLNDVIVKFYNKDLIDINPSAATTQSNSLYTEGGANFFPRNFNDFGWKEALNKWVSTNPQQYGEQLADYQERAVMGTLHLYPDAFSYQVADPRRRAGKVVVPQGQNQEEEFNKTVEELWNTTDEEVDQYGRYLLADSTATNFGNLVNEDGYNFVFYKGSESVSTPNYTTSFEEWKKNNLNFVKNQVSPTYGRYLFVKHEPTNKYDIFNNEHLEKLGELNLDNKTGINCIFLNFLSEGDRNSWVTGDNMKKAADNGDNTAAMMIIYAKSNYENFIRKNRSLANYYLVKYNEAQHQVNSLTQAQNFSNDQVEEAQRDLNNSNAIIRRLNNREPISPFTLPNPMIDQPFSWPRGGGRYLNVDGMVAQQWAARFDNRTRYGVTDIQNYNPPIGGLSLTNYNSTNWGWSNTYDVNISDSTTYDDNGIKIGAAQILKSFIEAAHFDESGLPYSILDIDKLSDPNGVYRYDGQTYNIRGIRHYDSRADAQPSALIANYRDNSNKDIMFFANDYENFDDWSPDQNARIGGNFMEVKYLVRAGVVNVDLIKDILSRNPNYSNMDFKLDGEISDAAYTIGKSWPLLNNYWGSHNEREEGVDTAGVKQYGSFSHASYIGPAHLVDVDLDFVVSVMALFPFPENYTIGSTINLGPSPMDSSAGDGVVTYKYDDNRTLWLWEPVFRSGDHSGSAMESHGQWVSVNLKADDYIKLNNRIVKYFDTMRGISRRSFFSRGSGSFMADESYSVYPNQELIYRDRATRNRQNILRDGDHIPNLPIKLAEKMVGLNPDVDNAVGVGGYGGTIKSSGRPVTTIKHPYGISARGGNGPVNIGNPDSPTIDITEDDNIGMNGAFPRQYSTGRTWPGPTAQTGVCVNDILNTLPDDFQKGFFNSAGFADVNFGGGTPLNSGLVKYFAEEFIHLFTNGRRMARKLPGWDTGTGSWAGTAGLRNIMHSDLTFKDLLANTELEDSGITMADFSNQRIRSVAEIPIKRSVVDNLLSKKNSNMSLLQFFQQILTPSSIGLAGNVQLGVRNVNGVVDIIPASISYKQQTNDFFKEQLDKQIEEEKGNDSSSKIHHLLFEYKKRNSLIENIDMSSKMDPAAFLTYQNSSDLLLGRDYNVLKLLSYEGVAEDFKEFLDGTQRADNSGQTYSGIITISADNRVRVDKTKFKELPSSIVDSMIAQNPERWAKITALMQGNNNFTTELLAFYMRGVTLTIHGTTNLQPFNLINVTGVMPDLEGIYIITNLTEKVTPTTFQTIIEGKLLKRKRLSDGMYI